MGSGNWQSAADTHSGITLEDVPALLASTVPEDDTPAADDDAAAEVAPLLLDADTPNEEDHAEEGPPPLDDGGTAEDADAPSEEESAAELGLLCGAEVPDAPEEVLEAVSDADDAAAATDAEEAWFALLEDVSVMKRALGTQRSATQVAPRSTQSNCEAHG